MKQGELRFEKATWGGRRDGAGRKRTSRAMRHESRDEIAGKFPLHVVWGMDRRVWNLRSGRVWKVLRPAFQKGAERFGGRLVEFSVMGNHLHLLVETTGREALGKAMRALGVRIARGLNRAMGTQGKVIGDRYFLRELRSPAEVRNAIGYVRNNYKKHAAEWGTRLPDKWRDPFASHAAGVGLAPARTWLLCTGLAKYRGPQRE